MNALSNEQAGFTVGFRALITILVLLAATSDGLYGQDVSSHPAADSAIKSHFAAAQQAQNSKDYAKAEREYRAVLALAPDFAEVHMNLGLLYQLQDRIPEAMTEFRRALKIKPTLAGANFFLGVDYCKVGEGAKAIPYLNAAVHEEPNRPDIWSWLATAQEMSGEIQAEVVTIKRGLDLQPLDVDLLYLLGHAYARLGNEEVVHLQKLAPGSFRAEQLLAESYAASSEWPSAVIHFQNALAASPGTPGLHVELGEVLLRAGKLKPAAREFDDELRLDPHSVRAIVRRGEAKLVQGDLDGSLHDWTQAIAIDEVQAERVLGIRETGFGDSAFEQLPDALREKIGPLALDLHTRNTAASHFALAFLATEEGNSSQAAGERAQAASMIKTESSRNICSENEVHQALKQGRFSGIAACVLNLLSARSPVEFRVQVASAMLEAGDYEASLQALAGLPPSGRHSAEASYWRARCYEKLATAAYLSLYRKDPNSHRLHQLMGDLAAARGEDGKAMEEYRAAIALKPFLPNLHYSLGHLLWKNLQIPEARVELRAELTFNPRHAGALDDLGNTYLIEHQPEKALPYLNRALAADPGNPDIHRDLGTAYSELGDYLKAEPELKIAVSNDRDGSVHYKLARVYQALGEKDKAAREFALSTALNRESHDKLEKRTERLNEVERSFQDP
jgi:tetratricopeptide (TPR) repeat protein